MAAELSVRGLEEQLLKAKEAYYNGEALISDSQYDALEEKLRNLNPDSEVLAKVGVNSGDVDLEFPMFSTDKSLNMVELTTYWNRVSDYTGDFVISQKVDGLSASFRYYEGILIEATTRGDGKFGKSFFKKVRYLKCLPRLEDSKFTGYIRGELYLTIPEFESLNSILLEEGLEAMKNPRNAVSGLLNSKDLSRESEKMGLISFKCWSVYDKGVECYDICGSSKLYSEQLESARDLGFDIVDYKVFKDRSYLTYELMEQWITSYAKIATPYNNDGLVIRANDNEYVFNKGTDSAVHHLTAVTAFKLKPEGELCKVLGYEYSYGSKEISLVLQIEPTFIDGAVISRVNAGSVKNAIEMDARIGETIYVTRSGSVIPLGRHRRFS